MKYVVPGLIELEKYPDDIEFKVHYSDINFALDEFKNLLFGYKKCELSKKEIIDIINIIENNCYLSKGSKYDLEDRCIINKKALYLILKYTDLVFNYEIKDSFELERACDCVLRKLITTNDDTDIYLYLRINSLNNIEDAKRIIEDINNSNCKYKNELLKYIKVKLNNILLNIKEEIEDITKSI